MDGIGFATTGDGGIANDYRIYPSQARSHQQRQLHGWSSSNTLVYYQAVFGTHTAPAVQLALSTAEYGSDASNTQAGSTQAGAFGSPGTVDLVKQGNTCFGMSIRSDRHLDVSSITLGAPHCSRAVRCQHVDDPAPSCSSPCSTT